MNKLLLTVALSVMFSPAFAGDETVTITPEPVTIARGDVHTCAGWEPRRVQLLQDLEDVSSTEGRTNNGAVRDAAMASIKFDLALIDAACPRGS